MHKCRADNRYLALLVCPSGVVVFVSQLKRALILLSGDVQLNPGPLSLEREKQLFKAIFILAKLQQGLKPHLNDFKTFHGKKQSVDEQLGSTSHRVNSMGAGLNLSSN